MELLLLAETDFNTMILGIVTTIFSFFGLVFTGFITYRVAALNREQKKLIVDVEKVHLATNGLTEKLGLSKLNEGKAQGKSEERDRADLQLMHEKQAVAHAATSSPVTTPVHITNPTPVPVKETP